MIPRPGLSIATALTAAALLGCTGGQASSTGSGSTSSAAGSTGSGSTSGGATSGGATSSGGTTSRGDWPDASDTGYAHAPGYPGALTPWDGQPLRSGHTYSFIDFPGGVDLGSSDTPATGITLIGCRFHGAAPGEKLVGVYGNDFTFDYCTFEPDVQPPRSVTQAESYQYGIAGNGGYYTHVGKLTVTHCDLWGWGNAIDVNPSTDPAEPQLYRDNYLHDAADVLNSTYHHDGIGAESGASAGSYVTIDHNTIESLGNTNAIAYQATGPYSRFTITDNLLGGFGYAVAILGDATEVTFTGNTFSTRLHSDWGPLYPDDFWSTPGSVWRNNRWRVPPGAEWGNPTHDGWFWLPTPGSTDDDTGYVSPTDRQP